MNQGEKTDMKAADTGKLDVKSTIEQCKNGIVHFDATIVRRHKMRQAAGQRSRTETTVATTVNGHNQPVQSQAHATGTNGWTNNHGQPIAAASANSSEQAPLPSLAPVAKVAPVAVNSPDASSSDRTASSGWWARVVRDAGEAAKPDPKATAQPTAEPQIEIDSVAAAVSVTAATVVNQSSQPPSTTNDQNASPASDAGQSTGVRSPELLRAFLINFVVEQTGYPEDIVEMESDLEADLGIDSIKKAQMFGEIGEYFAIEPDENLSLDNFPNLQSVLEYLIQATSSNEHVAPTSAPTSPIQGGPTEDVLKTFLINFVVEQTGYPEDIVELDADLEADLGIDSIKKAQMFGEIGEYFSIQPDENLSLDDFPDLNSVLQYLIKVTAAPQRPAALMVATPIVPTASVDSTLALESVLLPTATATSIADAVVASLPHDRRGPTNEDLQTFLINFVVEQTGYPEDIVEMEADLEADLGIDSIKKAQMFGEIGEYFGIQPDESLSLDDFRDLRSVLSFLAGQVGNLA